MTGVSGETRRSAHGMISIPAVPGLAGDSLITVKESVYVRIVAQPYWIAYLKFTSSGCSIVENHILYFDKETRSQICG